MTEKQLTDIIEFVMTLVSKANAPIAYCHQLMQIARVLHYYNEDRCNQDLTKWQITRERNLIDEANKIASQLECELIHNQDPRGPSILLKLPSGKTNDWGQRGYIVPEL